MRPVFRRLAEQAFVLQSRFLGSTISVGPKCMTWTGTLQPTPLSREYTVRITYELGQFPRVKVLPRLPSRPGEPLPHFYREGLLCLHKVGEWSPRMLIADTIVPWACEWLLHYEIWLATGVWHGGGEDPLDSEPVDSSPGGFRRLRRAHRPRTDRRRRRTRSRETESPARV